MKESMKKITDMLHIKIDSASSHAAYMKNGHQERAL